MQLEAQHTGIYKINAADTNTAHCCNQVGLSVVGHVYERRIVCCEQYAVCRIWKKKRKCSSGGHGPWESLFTHRLCWGQDAIVLLFSLSLFLLYLQRLTCFFLSLSYPFNHRKTSKKFNQWNFFFCINPDLPQDIPALWNFDWGSGTQTCRAAQ